MDSPSGSPLRGHHDRRPSNLLWIVVGAAVLLAIVLTAVSTFPSVELSTSQFLELIEKEKQARAQKASQENAVSTAEAAESDAIRHSNEGGGETPDANDNPVADTTSSALPLTASDPKNFVIVARKSGKTKKEYYGYYQLQDDLVIGSTSASGKVKRMKLDPETKRPIDKEQTVSFFVTLNPDQVDSLIKELDRGLDWNAASQPGPFETWGPFVIISLLFLGVLYLMMRRLGQQPAQFGRSRGKMYAQEDLGVTFEHVAGIDEALEEVKEIVEFLREPEKYQKLGGRIPKGILLVGPPGTGKTLLARAIAGEAGVPFFGLSGSDFVEMFVGVGAARVRDTFEMAAAKAPCIIFIDELDALGKTRGNGMIGGHDEREQTLNALLVEMDGFDANAGVIVMAATNRPETLDPALLRPGRFDRHVLVDKPDVKGREAILKVHAQHIKMSSDVQLKEIANITSGFAGADLANLVNEAALLAARKGKSQVEMVEFDEAVERVTAGLEKKQRIMSDEEKIRVAYHESGHALAGHCLPNTDPIHKISIIPRGLAALGYVMHRPEGDRFLITQAELESRIQVLLAGTVAEELTFHDVSTGANNDLERASEIARSMVMDFGMSRLGRVCFRRKTGNAFLNSPDSQYEHTYSEQTAREIDDEVKRVIDESLERVRELLISRKGALEALAERLLEVEVVDAAELRRIMEANSAGPQIVPGTTHSKRRFKLESGSEAQSLPGEAGA